MIAPFDPPPPGPMNFQRFQDLRSFLITWVVNKWMQYVTRYVQDFLLPVLNTQLFNYGPDIASAASITPSAAVHRITGTAAIATINAPVNFAGAFDAIAVDGFTTVTTGNILLAVAVPANHMAHLAYHPVIAKWGIITS
jgi:hypothetical protein